MPESFQGASPLFVPEVPLLEHWKPVVGWEGLYEISNMGRVWSVRNAKERRAFPNNKGYVMVQFHRGGKISGHQVHGLVATHFVGSRPDGLLVNHKNGAKCNNLASNLEYMTSLENTRHAMAIGIYTPGRYHNKLDDDDVANIRELLALGLYTIEIGSLYGIDPSAISRIKNGRFKTRLRMPVKGVDLKGECHPRSALTDEDVLEIRRLRPTWGLRYLAERFNVSKTTISDAALGKTYSHLPGVVGKQNGGGPRRAAPAFD